MGVEFNLLTFLIVLSGGTAIVLSKVHSDESSRGFSMLTMALIFLSALLVVIKNPIIAIIVMVVYSTFVIVYGRIKYYDVKITRKFIETNEVSHNFKAIFLTDFQFDLKKTKFNSKAYDNVIDICNTIDYDIVLLGGDYINYIENIKHVTDGINRLNEPRYGIYACMGNHDYVSLEGVKKAFSENNINLLINEKAVITDEIVVSAVDDFWKGTPEMPKIEEEKLNIMLCHNPKYIDTLHENNNIDLMLCGHYHAGQVNYVGVSFQRLVTKYIYGWYNEKNINMFVSSGIGGNLFRGLFGFQIRYFARPEIVEIVFVGNKHNEEKK